MEFEHLYLEILSPLFWNMDTFNLNLKELNVYITLVSINHYSAILLSRSHLFHFSPDQICHFIILATLIHETTVS